MMHDEYEDDFVEIEGEVRHETAKAYFIFDGKTEAWVPKSKVEFDKETGIFIMPRWMADEKELI